MTVKPSISAAISRAASRGRQSRRPPGRCADGEKYRIRRTNGRCRFGRKRKPAGFDIACNERVQARLEDRHLPVLELSDLGCIPIDTGYDVPEIGKTGAGHEPDVAGTDHCYSHEVLPEVCRWRGFVHAPTLIFYAELWLRGPPHLSIAFLNELQATRLRKTILCSFGPRAPMCPREKS
jgi:hypothetical protein